MDQGHSVAVPIPACFLLLVTFPQPYSTAADDLRGKLDELLDTQGKEKPKKVYGPGSTRCPVEAMDLDPANLGLGPAPRSVCRTLSSCPCSTVPIGLR